MHMVGDRIEPVDWWSIVVSCNGIVRKSYDFVRGGSFQLPGSRKATGLICSESIRPRMSCCPRLWTNRCLEWFHDK